ncbi:MAG TPA: hypothetical protein VD833_10765 [Vicinamibacterales bacterium]|nr:hypothetical protein [Vicinamibacterales bacterium]
MPREAALQSFIRAVRRRWFAQVILAAAGKACALAAIPIAAAVAADRIGSFEGSALAVVAVGVTALVVVAVWSALPSLSDRPSDVRVARFVEERVALTPGAEPLDDALVSAVAPGPTAVSPGVRDLLARAALARLDGTAPQLIVPRALILRAGSRALGGTVLLLASLVLAADPLARTMEALLVAFPGSVQVLVHPGDARVVAGQPLRIRAVVSRRGRSLVRQTPSLTVSAGSEQRTVPMQPDGEGFVFPFESVDRTFRYRVSAGAAVSADHTVTALFPPRVRRIDLRYDYPGFTSLPPREEENGGDIYGPRGTRVRVRVHTDGPVVSGELAMGAGDNGALRPAGDRVLEADLVLARDDSYRVGLLDGDGLRSTGGTQYFIRLMDDRPPDVRIVRPAGDQQITPLEEVLIEARADDDHGIETFELVYTTPAGQTRAVPFASTAGNATTRLGAHLLAAEDLRVRPGDVIAYHARARDVGRGRRPTLARSDMFFLEVRPFNEEFVSAQSQAGGAGADPELESLITAQKEIINATWNLERRSGAGRSVTDLRAVALAQADLKARVEQIAGRNGRGRSSWRPPQRLLPQAGRGNLQGADLVSRAADAMGRAVGHLDGLRTAEALPQQMAALQALLQAQAEVRRRQVLQQQAGGAGGAGRQGQDLSALFDKELQRQQRTNYETRSEIEDRPDRRNDSALDRIRDLARRQEELSRRQRDLAEAKLSAEELKRQLERLTREQTELREQVEELARQQNASAPSDDQAQGDPTPQQGSQPGSTRVQGDPAGNASQGTGAMRDASEEMRAASSDLQRANPNAAAESAGRAAERLREIEQAMRGDGPEARLRVAGELRLEARQIAEEQRRIAAEAERLDRAAAGSSVDARRRLAGEKDRLAERVDGLQRAAEQLAGAGNGGTDVSQVSARDVARELTDRRIGQRMRDTARQMREEPGGGVPNGRGGARGPEAGPLAEPERELARAMNEIVDRLGTGEEGGDVSAGLGQTQAIRERLDRLEQAIRDRETRAQTGRGPQAAPGDVGRQGREGRGGNTGAGEGGELEKLREEYARELQRARETVARLQRSSSRENLGGATPEHHEWSQADPGTEPFKQDYTGWASLRRDVDDALDRYESALSAELASNARRDRLSAGGSDRVPDAYRKLIARYYEALAKSGR